MHTYQSRLLHPGCFTITFIFALILSQTGVERIAQIVAQSAIHLAVQKVAAREFMPSDGAATHKTHAIAMYGTPKYPADFRHFAYTNPAAPRGGTLKLHSIGTFDSLNRFIMRGNVAQGTELLYDTLMVPALDESFTYYGLIAEMIEVPEDRSWVIFHLNPAARFHDEHPVHAEDVVFTFHLLLDQGAPQYQSYYADVASAEALDTHRVRFRFTPNIHNRELPLILAQLPVLPKHFWQENDFNKVNLDVPLGSGPYRIEQINSGKSITYVRDPDYWAEQLSVNKGRYNFKRIHFDYYRDDTVAMEGFKAGQYDVRQEYTAKIWATGYRFPAAQQGQVITEEIKHKQPAGMQAFVFNTRRPQFQDRNTRLAISQLFDFAWSNQHLFYHAYKRTQSYFANSEFAATGLPSSEELALLEPFRNALPDAVFHKVYQAPGVQNHDLRRSIKSALGLLQQSGWKIQSGKLTNQENQPLKFEILLVQRGFERVILPFIGHLKRLGIEVNLRLVDVAQYVNRIRSFDFDMIVASFPQSTNPGNEQRNFWHSSTADQPGSRNMPGIKNKVVDALIERLIQAEDKQSLIHAVKALDRVLLWQHYVIPQWHTDYYRIARWQHIKKPAGIPDYGLDLYAWWHGEDTNLTKDKNADEVITP